MRTLLALMVCATLALTFLAAPIGARGSPSPSFSACIAHHPLEIPGGFGPYYTGGCTGHDEPELDPVSSAPGSARNLTWTVVLPSDGAVPVSAVGPTFWFGGTVSDPASRLGQAFVELQFYPDGIVTKCGSDGSFSLRPAPDLFTVCSPVWKVSPTGNVEKAAFNTMLTAAGSSSPLVMHGGDMLTIHWFTTPAADGFHVTVSDLSTHRAGTIVLNSRTDGPLMPAFDAQSIGNALGWGLVNDTPNAFVWEIGHTSDFLSPAGEFCLPGQAECASYNAASWGGIQPIRILNVTFGGGSTAKAWAVVSDLGGKAEISASCPTYGAPYCTYPWYTRGTTGLHYGVDYAGTIQDFGQATEFAQQPLCGGPFGPNTTFCDTTILP